MSGAGRVLAAAVAVLLGGCSLFVDLDPGVRDHGDADDGGPGNGDGGQNDGDAGPCGAISRLEDSFPSGPLSSHWIARTQGDEAEPPSVDGSGRLALGFTTEPATDDEFSEVESRFAYDLRGHAVTVWADVVDDRSWSTLEVREAGAFDSSRKIVALGRKGTVFAAFVRAPDQNVLHQEVWSASLYRYWRIRDLAGALEFQVAGADQVFSTFTTLELPGIDLAHVMVGLAVNADVTPSTVGLARFDDLGSGDPPEPACPVETLHDDFSSGELGPLWIDDSDGCTVTASDGLAIDAADGATCAVDSSHAYSMGPGGELVVEITALPAANTSRFELRLAHDDDNYLAVQQQDGQLAIVLVERGGAGEPMTGANAVSAQWWRVREQGGRLEVATSPDGASFSPRGTITPGTLDLAELRVSFQLRVSNPDSAGVGRVNITPRP